MKSFVKYGFVLLFLVSTLPVAANSLRIFKLNAEEWAQPRSGAVITEFVAIKSAVEYWDKNSGNGLLIRYPGEDSGEIWAAELRDWIISLGIPSDYIELVSGSPSADEIVIIVGKRDELKL